MDDVTHSVEPGDHPVFGSLRMKAIKVIGALFAINDPVADHRINNQQHSMSDCDRRLLHPGLAADAIEEGREETPFPADPGRCPRGLHHGSSDIAIALIGSAGIPFPGASGITWTQNHTSWPNVRCEETVPYPHRFQKSASMPSAVNARNPAQALNQFLIRLHPLGDARLQQSDLAGQPVQLFEQFAQQETEVVTELATQSFLTLQALQTARLAKREAEMKEAKKLLQLSEMKGLPGLTLRATQGWLCFFNRANPRRNRQGPPPAPLRSNGFHPSQTSKIPSGRRLMDLFV
jgi:hypothetical protein